MATLLDPRYKNNSNVFSNLEKKMNEQTLIAEAEMLASQGTRRVSETERPATATINNENEHPLDAFLSIGSPPENFTNLFESSLIQDEISNYLKVKIL